MRRRVLVSSVQRLLPTEVTLIDVVFMWRRSGAMYVWAAGAAALAVLVTTIFDYGSGTARLALALAAALAAAVVTTESRVLAHTDAGPYSFVAGRVRQVATRLIGPLPDDAELAVVGSNLVLTDWVVGTERFSVPRTFQAAMTRLAAER
ncbi:MAG: hypothetical protein AB8G26_20740 [Ilumatobacter sp.]